ncbi:hypothetical protein BHE74_00017699 [Ensete ventricosum]|nr:hypothetical protein BHE74_00017699 [Ensete ventricosum]
MSDHVFPEQACYVNCNFCNTPLVVYTLSLSLSQHSFVWATESLKESNRVREKNEEGSPTRDTFNFLHLISASSYCKQQPRSDVFHLPITSSSSELLRSMSSSYCSCILLFREEIRRLKAKDPDISHKEAFSTAAKNVSMGTLPRNPFRAIYEEE